MKLTTLILCLCLSAGAIAAAVERSSAAALFPVLRESRRCNVNVCWALDGSGSITPDDFIAEKSFVTKVSGAFLFIKGPSQVGALQYATIAEPIQTLTPFLKPFVRKMNNTEQSGGLTNVDSALLACRFILTPAARKARHIILMTDGDANIGKAGIEQAKAFRKSGGLVSIVAAGTPNTEALEDLAGPSGTVYSVDRFGDDLAMINISNKLFDEVCKSE